MSTLSYTYALTPNTPENVSHVMQNFNDVKTWANGNIDSTNLSATANLTDTHFASTAGMYATYRTLATGGGLAQATLVGADHWFSVAGVIVQETTNSTHVPKVLYLDDADFTIAGRTPKLRIRAKCYTNATAPAMTFTVGLFPVSSVTGGVNNLQATLGAVTSGSTVAFASPSASSINQNNSGDFTFPADGHYVLGVTLSGAPAANSATGLQAWLQLRWV